MSWSLLNNSTPLQNHQCALVKGGQLCALLPWLSLYEMTKSLTELYFQLHSLLMTSNKIKYREVFFTYLLVIGASGHRLTNKLQSPIYRSWLLWRDTLLSVHSLSQFAAMDRRHLFHSDVCFYCPLVEELNTWLPLGGDFIQKQTKIFKFTATFLLGIIFSSAQRAQKTEQTQGGLTGGMKHKYFILKGESNHSLNLDFVV